MILRLEHVHHVRPECLVGSHDVRPCRIRASGDDKHARRALDRHARFHESVDEFHCGGKIRLIGGNDEAARIAPFRAFQQAMLFLSYRARSESEIRQNLRKHEIPEPVIEQTLDRLRQDGLANDDQFARAWVENRSTFRPRSRRLMAMELRQKGLNDEAVSSAIADVDDDALAYEAAQKKVARYKDLEWNEFRKKLSDFLARRGFSYSVVAPVVTRIWNEARNDEQHYEEEDST